jgi:hypothetical protein
LAIKVRQRLLLVARSRLRFSCPLVVPLRLHSDDP